MVTFGLKSEGDKKDQYHHNVAAGDPYIEVNYFEKKTNSEFHKGGQVSYKLLKGTVFVHPCQVMSPKVNVTCIGNDIILARDEYQWMCDSI